MRTLSRWEGMGSMAGGALNRGTLDGFVSILLKLKSIRVHNLIGLRWINGQARMMSNRPSSSNKATDINATD